MLVDIIGAIGDSGICGMCTMSLAVIVACITGGGERGEFAGEFTHDPDREWRPERCCTPFTIEV